MESSSAERGRHLERAVAEYFQRSGYTVRTNQVIVGRTGGSHEIDVLAEKADALMTVRVAIECKAWGMPIEKDVVSKLHYVMGDIGIHKGIVVSLAGSRSGAVTAAAELGIDLWGPDELRHHLGPGVFAAVAGPATPSQGSGQLAWGYSFRTDPDLARQLVERAGKGRFGLRTLESAAWFAPIWVPAYAAQLTVAQPVTQRLRQRLTSVVVNNLYEALGGGYVGHIPEGMTELQLGSVVALKPLRREAQLDAGIRKALDARARVTTPTATHRHEATLRSLGVPVPCRSVAVERTTLVYLPVFAGILRAPGGDRVIAVGGDSGAVSERLSSLLTSNLAYLRQSFGG